MAFAPVGKPGKRRLFSAPPPNYKDFSSPPHGDYVRYVEGLMDWAEQEQERQRLQALDDKARGMADSAWGRASAAPGAAQQPRARPPAKKAGSAAQGMQRKALAAARTSAKAGRSLMMLALVAGMVLAGIFAPPLLPVAVICWVAFNVWRAVRTGWRSGKS